MRGLLASAAGVALCCVSSAAFSADPISQESFQHRFYASIHGGWVVSSTSDDTASKPAFPTIVSQAVGKPGYIVGIAAGHDFSNGFKVEGEANYSAADVDHFTSSGISFPATGGASTVTVMANALVSLPTGQLSPYVGAGAGVAYFTANNITGAGATLNGSDWGFAYQLMAGADFAATQNISVGARYRYVKVTDLSLMDGGYKHDFSTTAQSVEFVLTNHFGN